MKLLRLSILIIPILIFASCNDDDGDPVTKEDLPGLSTGVVSNIASTSATFSATVFLEGKSAVTGRGFCWATTQQPTVSDTFSTNAFGPGTYTFDVTGLTPNTTYYVKAYATNSQGTSYGAQVSFKTLMPVYNLGDTGPAGGLVFYLDGSGGGMEMAPVSTEALCEWGCTGILVSATGTAVGTGSSNTVAIVNGCGAAGIAARICSDLLYNGFGDWYLPSKDELHLIQTNLFQNGLGELTGNRYWSSSESSANSAWWEDMALISQGANTKSNSNRVRAVRTF